MTYLYIFSALIILVAVAARFLRKEDPAESPEAEVTTDSTTQQEEEESEECCGQHETCEKDSLLAAVSKDVEYYEDEELDRFRTRRSDEYTAEEVEEFQEILYTMRNDEVAGWVRSLQLRHIELPDPIKDEVFLIIGERRMNP
ncbi:MAG: phospholipase [Bacteroidaceae bacterium]|jgi:hypothetical protein|nr:phospholipase [Bacteroidaceae bacterium]